MQASDREFKITMIITLKGLLDNWAMHIYQWIILEMLKMLNKISHIKIFFCGFINRWDTVETDLVDRLEELLKSKIE